jgi:hypothetical protein
VAAGLPPPDAPVPFYYHSMPCPGQRTARRNVRFEQIAAVRLGLLSSKKCNQIIRTGVISRQQLLELFG